MRKKAKTKKLYGLRRYWPGMTLKEAEAERAKLSVRQAHRCAICERLEVSFKSRLAVDHNHKTGLVRGLLCYRCNRFVVGRHDIHSATRLFNYLQVELDV